MKTILKLVQLSNIKSSDMCDFSFQTYMSTARLLKHVWPFFNIMNERVEKCSTDLPS